MTGLTSRMMQISAQACAVLFIFIAMSTLARGQFVPDFQEDFTAPLNPVFVFSPPLTANDIVTDGNFPTPVPYPSPPDALVVFFQPFPPPRH